MSSFFGLGVYAISDDATNVRNMEYNGENQAA